MSPSDSQKTFPSGMPSGSDGQIEQMVKARNELRRGVLPLLDEKTEIARERAIRRRQEFQAIKDAHRPVLDQFMRDTLAEFRRERGPRFGDSFGAHYLVALIAHRRFDAYLEQHGIRPSGVADGAADVMLQSGEPV